MEKRIFAAIAISIAFLWLWAAIAPRIFPELARTEPVPAAPTTTQPPAATTGSVAPPAAVSTAAPSIDRAPAAVAPQEMVTPVAAEAVRETVVETDAYIARFTNRGAQLVSFRLRHYKQKDGSMVELVKSRPPNSTNYPFAIEAQSAALARRLNTALYTIEEKTDRGSRVLEYRYAGADGV